MKLNTNQQAFFELLRAGLWKEGARLSPFDINTSRRVIDNESIVFKGIS